MPNIALLFLLSAAFLAGCGGGGAAESGSNNAPVADAGADQSSAVGVTVTLSGIASRDPDRQALNYAWGFASMPAGSTAVLSSTRSVSTSFVPSTTGTYVVRLVVSDGALSSSDTVTVSINALTDPLAIGALTISHITTSPIGGSFTRSVDIAGHKIYATASVSTANIKHAAAIAAQYLDNNEDGLVDNPAVVHAMNASGAVLVMTTPAERRATLEFAYSQSSGAVVIQDLGDEETHPEWHTRQTGRPQPFDGALEEILHIITQAGYANAYPQTFGEVPGTALANNMDIARGGQFLQSFPSISYPPTAWYTYDDTSCNYACQIAEYFYWALTSLLGAQTYRSYDIRDEWKLHTRHLLRTTDTAMYALLTTSTADFILPTRLPDGSYNPATTKNITNVLLSNNVPSCVSYVDSYASTATDVTRGRTFSGSLRITRTGDQCSFATNAIPNHDFNDGQTPFANGVQAQSKTYRVPVEPAFDASTSRLMLGQDDAIFLNGVKLDLLAAACYGVGGEPLGTEKIGCGNDNIDHPWRYDPMSPLNDFGTDSHNAHAQPDGTYHYHGNPNALFSSSTCTTTVSPVIGFAADGFPVYGGCFYDATNSTIRKAVSSYRLRSGARQGVSGYRTPTAGTGTIATNSYDGQFISDYEYVAGLGDLDECNGMTAHGQYGYYVTDNYPWVLNCFRGTPDTATFGTGGGPRPPLR